MAGTSGGAAEGTEGVTAAEGAEGLSPTRLVAAVRRLDAIESRSDAGLGVSPEGAEGAEGAAGLGVGGAAVAAVEAALAARRLAARARSAEDLGISGAAEAEAEAEEGVSSSPAPPDC